MLSKFFQEEESSACATALGKKIEPFYVSLSINDQKMSNCIITLGASENVIPASLSCSMGLPLINTFDICYSMDANHVSLVLKIKDT